MPNEKYVTGVGKRHIRVTDIRIKVAAPTAATEDSPDPLVATVAYTEAESVLMADGSVREFATLPQQSFEVRTSHLGESRALVHPDTDVNLGTTTVQMIQAHVFAQLRHHQRQRDGDVPA